MPSSPAPGGFLPPALLSPAPSTTSSQPTSRLPRPRSHPLKSGSAKESAFITYVDGEILKIQRRYAKKFSELVPPSPRGAGDVTAPPASTNGSAAAGAGAGANSSSSADHVRGYKSYREVARDIERVVDIVWVSATPSLQVSYLLSLALLAASYMSAFPAAPRAMFGLLEKLDVAFASLLVGRDVETGEMLPGWGFARGVSGTERVRMRSLVEGTRVGVVDVMGAGGEEEEEEEEEDDDNDDNEDDDVVGNGTGAMGMDDEEGTWDMRIARVYERTVVELGDTIGAMTPVAVRPG